MVKARIGVSQGQRQAQSLTMTPALQQAIQLLQLPSHELRSILTEALETNPLLSDDEPNAATSLSPTPTQGRPRPRRYPARGQASGPQIPGFFGSGPGTAGGDPPGTEGGPAIDQSNTTDTQSLLLEAISFAFTDPDERTIALDLLALLDDAGYLAGSIEDVAAFRHCALNRVEAVLEKLQSVSEPPGLFARDLSECLALQLRLSDRLTARMQRLLSHLDLLADGKMDQLAKRCGVDPETLLQMVESLRSLNPRPGAGLVATVAEVVIPDLQIRPVTDQTTTIGQDEVRVGNWILAVNPEIKPRISTNRDLYDRLRNQSRNPSDKSYLTDQWQSATWLLRALDQRFATLLKVGAAVVQHQTLFMEKGLSALRPFTQREAATLAEVHESTISRAAHDKYIDTPQGTFPIGFFFSAAIEDLKGGADHSSKVVRKELRALISSENKALSDDVLAQKLRQKGYNVARRTVAKYRTQMRIPSSIRRRIQNSITY